MALTVLPACRPRHSNLAVYEGGSVDSTELDSWARDLPGPLTSPPGAGDREVLEGRITAVAMAKYLVERAERSGMATDPTIELALRFLVAQDSAGRFLESTCGGSEAPAAEVDRVAELLRSRSNREWIVLRHIYKEVPPGATAAERQAVRAEIERLRELVVSGADFAEIARRDSDSETAERGGLIGRISRRAAIEPAVLDAAWALADGELSRPIEVSNGFHLLLRESSGSLPEEPSRLREIARDQVLDRQRASCRSELLAELQAAPDVTLGSSSSGDSGDSNAVFLRVGEESFSRADVELLERAQGVLLAGPATSRPGGIQRAFFEALLLERAFLDDHPERIVARREAETRLRRSLLITHELLSERRQMVEDRPEQELRRYYEEHREAFSTEPVFDVSLILVAGESRRGAWETTRRLRQRILDGEDFARVAADSSSHPSAAAGGRLEGRSLSELTALLGAEARSFLLSEEAGRVSAPLQTPRGFALLRVDAVTPPHARPFEEARPLVLEAILRERADALQSELRQRLLEEMNLHLDENAIEARLEERGLS